MKSKLIMGIVLILLLISMLTLAFNVLDVKAQTVTKLPLPDDYIPIGVVYSGGYIWTVSYPWGAISKIDIEAGTVVDYYIEGTKDTGYEWCFYGLTVDADGNFWIASRVGKLVKFIPGNQTFEVKKTGLGEFNSVLFKDNYLYFASRTSGNLCKYDVATDSYTTYTVASPNSDSFYGFATDGVNIWFSGIVSGKVYKFDGATITEFTDFHRPLGIAFADGHVHVAENVRWENPGYENGWIPAIARLNPANGTLMRINVTGSPYGVISFNYSNHTHIAWSSSGEDEYDTVGIGILYGAFYNVSAPAVFYMFFNDNTIYFTYYGSSGVGAIEDVIALSVGGIYIPVNKLELLAPYIGLVSTVVVATAATAIYVKRVKRRKKKQ